jgi:hypothetical protein
MKGQYGTDDLPQLFGILPVTFAGVSALFLTGQTEVPESWRCSSKTNG